MKSPKSFHSDLKAEASHSERPSSAEPRRISLAWSRVHSLRKRIIKLSRSRKKAAGIIDNNDSGSDSSDSDSSSGDESEKQAMEALNWLMEDEKEVAAILKADPAMLWASCECFNDMSACSAV